MKERNAGTIRESEVVRYSAQPGRNQALLSRMQMMESLHAGLRRLFGRGRSREGAAPKNQQLYDRFKYAVESCRPVCAERMNGSVLHAQLMAYEWALT